MNIDLFQDFLDGNDVQQLTEDLCRYTTGVVSEGNAAFFEKLQNYLPFTIHRYQSGLMYNGWTVPSLWKVKHSRIKKDGEIIYDCGSHHLGTAYYSKSFEGEIDYQSLKKHLVTSPRMPDALLYHCMWLYRPWAADWALSIPHRVYAQLTPGAYQVELQTSYEPGEMLVAEFEHKGRSDKTIIFNAHTCHPRMANDDMAGVALLIRLFQALSRQQTHYTYRLVLAPEHLGTVFYLRERTPEELGRFCGGAFIEMPGVSNPLKLTTTFLGGQAVDKAFGHAARAYGAPCRIMPWRNGAGNDETVWEAPGYEVPFVEMSRCGDPDDPYPEYHTDKDTAASMDTGALHAYCRVVTRAVGILENNCRLYRLFNGLICLSNPKYDLYFERPDPAVVKDIPDDQHLWSRLFDSLLRYFDGSMTVVDIADKHDLPFDRVLAYVRKYEAKGLVRLEFDEATRPPISEAAG